MAGHSWHVGLLVRTEPGRRNRRTIDSVWLFWAAVVLGLSAAIAASAPVHDRRVGEALTTLLGWADPLRRASFFLLLASAAAIVVAVLLERRGELAPRPGAVKVEARRVQASTSVALFVRAEADAYPSGVSFPTHWCA
jgi:uncharacterized membrane protein